MPAPTLPANTLAVGPGWLFRAPLSTAAPTNTVAGSAFTDAWPGAWVVFGITKEGSEFSWGISTDKVEAAEYLDPLQYVTTERAGSVKFELMDINATNHKIAFNGGTLGTTGAGATLLSTYTPPAAGAETRIMLGWESLDGTERYVWYQCLQTGSVTIARKKGADVATLPLEFSLELPVGLTQPFSYYGAGVNRG